MIDQDHHYLPQFHLEQWCDANGNVGVFSRPYDGKLAFSTRLTPRGTGFERNLYTLHAAVPDQRQVVETTFFTPMIDTPASRVLPKLLANEVGTITNSERSDFTRYILSLRARHPDAVEHARKTGGPVFLQELRKNPEKYESIANKPSDGSLEEFVDRQWPTLVHQDFGTLMLPEVITNKENGERLCRMPWWTHDLSKGGVNLLLGDRPVVLQGNLLQGSFIAITPLSPWVLLFICNHPPSIDRWRKMPSSEVAKLVNKASVCLASDRVYALDRAHEPLVAKYLRG